METNTKYFLIFLIFLFVIGLGVVLWLSTGNNNNNNENDNTQGNNCDDLEEIGTDNGSNPEINTCQNITNTHKGLLLGNVKIHLKGRHDSVLSPSATEGNGLCFLGNTSQPLSVVDPDQESGHNWEFDNNGYLKYTDKDVFNGYKLGGIKNNYYVTFTSSKIGDNDNTTDCWYGIDDPQGSIYAASMTILPVNINKGCQPQICVSWNGYKDGQHEYITTSIKGKTYFLTANTCNNFVFWYSTNKDSRFHDRQLWSVGTKKNVTIIAPPHQGDDCDEQEKSNSDCDKEDNSCNKEDNSCNKEDNSCNKEDNSCNYDSDSCKYESDSDSDKCVKKQKKSKKRKNKSRSRHH